MFEKYAKLSTIVAVNKKRDSSSLQLEISFNYYKEIGKDQLLHWFTVQALSDTAVEHTSCEIGAPVRLP